LFVGAVPLPSGSFEAQPHSTARINCSGYEFSLASCDITVTSLCISHADAAVVCQGNDSTVFSNCTDGDVRLVNSSSPVEGRVEVCYNNAWGTVCNNQFSSEDATVVCHQLGLEFGKLVCDVV